jgi:hypothetical protein
MEEALRQQTINRLQKKQQLAADESTSDSTTALTERSNSSNNISCAEAAQQAAAVLAPDIELVFKPYPGQSGSGSTADTRYIKTTVNATGK